MFLIYFGFVVLLSGCGLRCVDCAPSLTPTNGNPVYVADGVGSYDLSWNYNTDGATIERVLLLYVQGNVDIHVAQKDENPNPSALVINPASGYSNRITFSIGSGSVGKVTFRISNIVQSDSRIFKCQLSFTSFNPAPIQSSTDLVVVVPPKITLKSPLAVTLDEGDARTLLCVASSNPTPSITWTKGFVVVSQTSNTNYTIASATKDDAGTYTCTVRVTAPGVSLPPDSYSVFVTVRYQPDVTNFTTGTPGNAVVQGTQVTLTCSANGYPPPTYTITRGNSPVPQSSPGKIVINSVLLSDEDASYSCVPTNKVGNGTSNSLNIVVQVPPFFNPAQTLPTAKQTKDEHQTVSYSCTAKAKPPAEFMWMLNGQNLTNTPPYNITGVISGPSSKLFTTIGYLTIKQLTWRQYGNFSCIAINPAGNVRQNTELEVRYAPQTVTLTPNPVDVPLSGSTILTCQADGFPSPTFSWKFNGKVLNGAQQNTLLLTNIEVKDAGTYTCLASNFRGSKETTGVVNVEYQPDVTNFTTGTPGNAVVQGTKVTLTCSANGYPAPTYTIIRGSTLASQSSPGKIVINRVLPSHEDPPYSCVPNNKVGNGPSKILNIVVQVSPTKESVDIDRMDSQKDQLSAAELCGIVVAIAIVVALAVYFFLFKRQGKKMTE